MKKYIGLILVLFLLCGCSSNKNIEYEKYCEKGMLVDDKCEVITEVKATAITCEDEDFTYNAKTKKCENVISIPANRRVGCKDEENYVLKNGACVPKSGKGARKFRINIYSCPDNARLNKNQCELVDEQDPIIACPEGSEANKEKATCERKNYEEPLEREK